VRPGKNKGENERSARPSAHSAPSLRQALHEGARHGNFVTPAVKLQTIPGQSTARAFSLTIAVHHRSFVTGNPCLKNAGASSSPPSAARSRAAMAITLMPAARPRIFPQPWKNADRALVIDAYEYNSIDWAGSPRQADCRLNRDQHDRLRRQRDRRL